MWLINNENRHNIELPPLMGMSPKKCHKILPHSSYWSIATMALNTNTASKAPIRSINMASQPIIEVRRLLGRTVRNMGIITVGPLTAEMAPNNAATDQSIANSQ